MEIPKDLVAKYQQGKYHLVRNKNPEVKGSPDYYKKNCEAMYSLYVRGRSWVAYDYAMDFDSLRAYSDGKQSEEIYKSYLSKEKPAPVAAQAVSDVDGRGGFTQNRSAKRSGFMNVLWKVISPAPKLAAKLQGMFTRAEYDIVCDPTDPISKAEIEDKELELWSQTQDNKFLRAYMAVAGVEMQDPDYMPETREEMKLYRERGGFKPEYAMYCEQAIQNSFKRSTWKEIKKKAIKDMIDLNVICVKTYYDDISGLVKVKYIDPKYASIQASRYHDFQDSEWAFHVEDYTVSELRERGVPRHLLETSAKAYSGYNGNPSLDDWDMYKTVSDDGTFKYDFYKVAVIEGNWIDTDSRQDLIRTNDYGGKKIIRQEYGQKNPTNEKSQTRVTDIKKLYKCSWVVGSDIIFDNGEETDYIREGRGVKLNYSFMRLDGKSITDQLIPIYDNFQILWLKYQNALAQAVNQGYAINYDAISSLSLGGSKASQEDIIKRFLETGILIFKQTDTRGRILNSNLPVYQLKGGAGDTLREVREGFLFNIQMVEFITGINPLSLGSSTDPNTPVATQEMAVAATNDTLRPILDGIIGMKESAAKTLMNCILIKLRYDKEYQKSYSEIIGERGVEVLKLAAKRNAKFDVNLEARPTDVERREIFESAKISLQSGRNGQPGITEADYFKILSIINGGGSLKLAEMVLESSIRRRTEQMQEYAERTAKIQQEGAIAQKEAANKGELEKIREKGKEDRETEAYKTLLSVAILEPSKQQAEAEILALQAKIDQSQAAQDTARSETDAPEIPKI